MILNGELKLSHKNHYNTKLSPFESDHFNGSWYTSSEGLASDFNLMMLGRTDGYVKAVIMKVLVA